MTAHTLRRPLVRAAALAASAALVATVAPAGPSASAASAPRAKVVITIKAEGTDLSGTIKSKRRACKADRRVLLYLQRGARGGSNDELFATDTSEVRNGVGHWATGNLGFEGRFYAKVKRSPVCRGATSRTVVAERND